MSNKVNESLFDLIHSLSKTEKRYFKLNANRSSNSSDNNSIRLFDAISKQKVYSEEKIFISFKGEAFLNRFSITKKRLYDNILSVLDVYHSSTSIESQLFTMIHSAEILFNKSLYDQAKKVLRSAEKLAMKNHMNEILLLISQKNKRLQETNGNLLVTQEMIDDIQDQDQVQIEEIKLYNKIWTIKSRLFERLSKKGVSRSDKESEEYQTLASELRSIEEEELSNDEVKYLYFHSLSAFLYAIGELKQSLFYMKKILSLFENKNCLIEINKQVSVYTNAIFVSEKLGEYKDSSRFLAHLKTIEREIDSNEDLTIKLFSSISSIELNIYLRKGDFDKAMVVAHRIENRLDELGAKIVPVRRAFLAFKIAVIYMGTGEFINALSWINRILNDSELDKTEDIIGYTQLLDLLIHVELNHEKLLPYSLKNTIRFFKTRNRLYTFEKVFLQFIRKLINCKDQFEIESIWAELSNELSEITDDSFESVALEYFDFKSWAEAKLKKKAFQIVVKEKYNETIRSAS